MFLSELFSELAEDVVELHDLDHVPEKASGVLAKLARFHQIKGLEYNRRLHKWIAHDSEGLTPFIRDAKHITSAAGMGTATFNED